MSWHFLAGQEEVYSEGISWDGEQFAPSKSKSTLGGYCLRDSETDCCQDSRSGMTLRRSTGTNGEAVLMWFQGDSRVRTYLPPAEARDLPAVDQDFGLRWRGSSARYSPDSYSWRTAQCSLLGGLELYSETFPAWGTMQDGEFSEQTMPELGTGGNGFGYWATPAHYEDRTSVEQFQCRMEKQGRTVEGAELSMQVRMNRAGLWPTPTRSDYRGRGPNSSQQGFPDVVKRGKIWPTPRVGGEEGFDTVAKRKSEREAMQHNLLARVEYEERNWPTPCATDHKGAGQTGELRDRLDYACERGGTKSNTYPTPKTNGFCGGSGAAAKVRENEDLTTEEKRSMLAGNGGQLNPDWVEWLMGWPIGWTRLKPIEMDWRDWSSDPADTGEIPRVGKGIENRVNRLKAIGNGQVPQVAAMAWEILKSNDKIGGKEVD